MKRVSLIFLSGLLLLLAACNGQEPSQPEGSGRNNVVTASPSAPPVSSTPLPTPLPTPEPTPEPTPAAYPYGTAVPASDPVEDDWFSDAVFIGDSRTDGLKLYGDLKSATFLSATSLSVFNIGKKEVKYNGGSTTALKALEAIGANAGKVYLSLGINELGWEDDQGYHDCYADLVNTVRELAPNAVIYIQLLIPVNTQRCAEKKMASYLNNDQVGVYNDIITQIATEKKIVLLDPGEAFVQPETGEPAYEMTGDGVHFNKEGYLLWKDYLKTHTVNKEDLT